MVRYHTSYGNPSERRKKRKHRRLFFITLFSVLLTIGIALYMLFQIAFTSNVWTAREESVEVLIPTGSDFENVKEILFAKGLILNRTYFVWMCKWLNYDENVKPGRYLLKNEMNNFSLIRLLRSGNQTPVQVTFNNMRDVYQLSGRIASQIEADSASIADLMNDSAYIAFLGYNKKTIPALFIPNTYEFYWTTNADGFVSRMFQENLKFWNNERKQKARLLQLSPIEVSTLASIVEKETNKNDEKARIAGVYLNRLKGGWRLQADPTLVFASGDFEMRRVLNIHKSIDSPYNTYLNAGLPPGPICIPSIASIDAVLNYETHYFYYFCAKDDLSGYHAFAESYAQHEINAWKYRKALDRLNISK